MAVRFCPLFSAFFVLDVEAVAPKDKSKIQEDEN